MKNGAKIIKKTNTNKLNFKIMEQLLESGNFAILMLSLATILNSVVIILMNIKDK